MGISKQIYLTMLGMLLVLGGNLAASSDSLRMTLRDERAISNYTMDVRLDTEKKMLFATTQLSWKNTTSLPTADLRFHLYYNAWRNDKSSYLTSFRYRDTDLSKYGKDDWAWCEITSMRILADSFYTGLDVTPALEYIQPNDGNIHDRTVLRLPLRRPVFPGETIQLAFTWEEKIPRPFNRTGVINDYYFMAQWFPKIGVLEYEGGWNCHQYIQTEYYSNFGTYDVKLTVPTGWEIGATGREIETTNNPDSTTTHRFYQEAVHDFAWTTSPYFKVVNRRFESANLPPVDMRLLLMPDHLDKEERYFQSTANALLYYGTWFFPYPYGHITIVDPAFQSKSGGMEYPTLFTGGTRWLSPVGVRQPESVTIHEAGHQFWYGLVANNEFEYAWMDEGFNVYSQHRIFRHYYPRPVLSKRYFEDFLPIVFSSVKTSNRTDGSDRYPGLYSAMKRDAMARPSWEHGPGAYGVNAYNQPALMLQTLENYLGWETFQQVLAAYFQQWKYNHPRPEDFFAVVNDISGQNMDWFFEQAYYSSNIFDYGVGKVSSKKVRPVKGYVEDQENLVWNEQGDENAENNYLSQAYVRRWGEAVFPMTVRLTFSDGEVIEEKWAGKERWKAFTYTRPAELVQVEVDPNHQLVLDVNYTNNSWTKSPEKKAAAWKWASKWMLWMQHMLEFMAFFS